MKDMIQFMEKPLLKEAGAMLPGFQQRLFCAGKKHRYINIVLIFSGDMHLNSS